MTPPWAALLFTSTHSSTSPRNMDPTVEAPKGDQRSLPGHLCTKYCPPPARKPCESEIFMESSDSWVTIRVSLRGDSHRFCLADQVVSVGPKPSEANIHSGQMKTTPREPSLERELLDLLGGGRDARIAARYHGFDGRGGETLQSVGNAFGITRERVRQIVATTS